MAFPKVDFAALEDSAGKGDFLDDDVAAEAFHSNPDKVSRLLLSFRNNIKIAAL